MNSTALELLAARLAHEQEEILARWRAEALAGGEVTLVRTLTRGDFYDHIPEFLDYLGDLLAGERNTTGLSARQHGAHRWQQGLDFEEVIHEWNLLHRVLADRITTHARSVGLESQTIQRAHRILSDAIDAGVAASLGEFNARQRLEAEARMRDLEAALEARDELAGRRSRGLREAAHDLRGSLHSVQLASRLLNTRSLDDQSRVIVERLGDAVGALSRMFTDLLDLARLEAGREMRTINDFDAAEVLGSLCAELRPLAEAEGLELVTHGPESLPVRGDAVKVQRIVQNLVLNALRYTPLGRIEVSWRAESGRRWSLGVCDTGVGLPESTAGTLAESLEDGGNEAPRPAGKTAAKAVEKGEEPNAMTGVVAAHGEGIGLAIVRHLCQLLDGVLDVDSMPGRGTTFRVLLPTDYPEPEEDA